MSIVYLGLGSNLGEKEKNIKNAICKIECLIGPVLSVSSFFYSKPWGFESENDFVNAVIAVKTETLPLQLLKICKQIESDAGRKPKQSLDYEDRSLDIDILIYEGIEMSTEELTIPHPLIEQRDFVIVPLWQVMKEINKNDIRS